MAKGNNIKIDVNRVKIITTVPFNNVDKVRDVLCNAGAGIIGNYTHCSMSIKCMGTFKLNSKANPYIGENNRLEFVEEDRLEVVCDIDKVKSVISKLKKVHSYEEPEIDIVPLLNEEIF